MISVFSLSQGLIERACGYAPHMRADLIGNTPRCLGRAYLLDKPFTERIHAIAAIVERDGRGPVYGGKNDGPYVDATVCPVERIEYCPGGITVIPYREDLAHECSDLDGKCEPLQASSIN